MQQSFCKHTTERKLLQGDEKLAVVFNSIVAAICYLDSRGRCTYLQLSMILLNASNKPLHISAICKLKNSVMSTM